MVGEARVHFHSGSSSQKSSVEEKRGKDSIVINFFYPWDKFSPMVKISRNHEELAIPSN